MRCTARMGCAHMSCGEAAASSHNAWRAAGRWRGGASCWQLLLTRRASSPGSGTCTEASCRTWLFCLREMPRPACFHRCVRINQSSVYTALYITHCSCPLGVLLVFSALSIHRPVASVCICTTPPRPLEATIACHDLGGQPPWKLGSAGQIGIQGSVVFLLFLCP
jgi:hypothetical protein